MRETAGSGFGGTVRAESIANFVPNGGIKAETDTDGQQGISGKFQSVADVRRSVGETL